MTYQEFKNKYDGKYLDYDGSYGNQCWDLAQFYFVEALGLSPDVLSGCGNVCNLLKEPKLSLLLQYFDEVSTQEMWAGDVCIWSSNHIAIFDHWDGQDCWYFSQNPGEAKVQKVNMSGLRAFRKKGWQKSSTPSSDGADQVLYKGSKVRFDGIFKVDILKSPFSTNLFGCCTLTGCSFDDYYNERVKDYHWLPCGDFDECDESGNKTKDQVLSGGNSYVKNDHVYTVLDIDIPTQSAKLNINGRDVWVFSKYLYEVSNN